MKKCACKGAFLERFIQPSILMLLKNEKLHGFSILKRLQDGEIIDYSCIDPTGLYRTLKKMEQSGILVSNWDMDSSSQPRRIYEITNEGKHCLSFWQKTLTEYAETIGSLAKAVTQSLEEDQ